MFIENEYYDDYKYIIDRAKSPDYISLDGIEYQDHHIIPKCMGGSNDKDNIVTLTIQDHYKCHELLPYFTQGKDRHLLIYAWNTMHNTSSGIIVDPEMHRSLSILHSERMMGNQYGALSSNMGFRWTEEQKANLSIVRKKSAQEEGYVNGMAGKSISESHRKIISNANKGKTKKRIDCDVCGKSVTVNTISLHKRSKSCNSF